MRFAEPQISRRGAFIFVALFSCLQITLGFFLINGNGNDSVLSNPIMISSPYAQAEYYDMDLFDPNIIEPASGDTSTSTSGNDLENEDPDIITEKIIESLSTLSTLEYGEQ